LAFHEIHAHDGQHFFAVMLRYGGPAFDFISARSHSEGEEQWIVSGSFSDYAHSIEDAAFLTDQSLYRTFPRPAAMAAAHREDRKYLRKNGRQSVCRETGQAGPWIGSGALQQHGSGVWLRGGDRHFDPK
jgi:hypothetical protein